MKYFRINYSFIHIAVVPKIVSDYLKLTTAIILNKRLLNALWGTHRKKARERETEKKSERKGDREEVADNAECFSVILHVRKTRSEPDFLLATHHTVVM